MMIDVELMGERFCPHNVSSQGSSKALVIQGTIPRQDHAVNLSKALMVGERIYEWERRYNI